MIATDPRYNAPPRVSDLHGDARVRVLAARDTAHRQTFMAAYAAPASVSSYNRRLARAFSSALTTGAVTAAAVLLVVMIWRIARTVLS